MNKVKAKQELKLYQQYKKYVQEENNKRYESNRKHNVNMMKDYYENNQFDSFGRPMMPLPSLWNTLEITESYEGYLKWLVEEKYK